MTSRGLRLDARPCASVNAVAASDTDWIRADLTRLVLSPGQSKGLL
jgi:hypothetical protein